MENRKMTLDWSITDKMTLDWYLADIAVNWFLADIVGLNATKGEEEFIRKRINYLYEEIDILKTDTSETKQTKLQLKLDEMRAEEERLLRLHGHERHRIARTIHLKVHSSVHQVRNFLQGRGVLQDHMAHILRDLVVPSLEGRLNDQWMFTDGWHALKISINEKDLTPSRYQNLVPSDQVVTLFNIEKRTGSEMGKAISSCFAGSKTDDVRMLVAVAKELGLYDQGSIGVGVKEGVTVNLNKDAEKSFKQNGRSDDLQDAFLHNAFMHLWGLRVSRTDIPITTS